MEFDEPGVCPVAAFAADADAAVTEAVPNVAPGETDGVTEFSMDAAADPGPGIVHVFSHGSTHRYRRPHDGGVGCPCESVGSHGCPVARYSVRDGTLRLVFHAADYDQLRAVVGDLRDRFPALDVTRLVRAPAGDQSGESVLVDRGKLTDRQLEVVTTAREMGYFDHPRRANATEVADALDIDRSTFREHLSAATGKVFDDLLE